MRSSEYLAFTCQSRQAKARRIPFTFTFEAWVNWWLGHLGPDWMKRRGRRKHQFVMARVSDNGPYSPENVVCITQGANCSERRENKTSAYGHRNGRAKLLEPDVVAIYLSTEQQAVLAKRYGVSIYTIREIQKGQKWKHVTKKLMKKRPPFDRRTLGNR